jgi:hypothetical protein
MMGEVKIGIIPNSGEKLIAAVPQWIPPVGGVYWELRSQLILGFSPLSFYPLRLPLNRGDTVLVCGVYYPLATLYYLLIFSFLQNLLPSLLREGPGEGLNTWFYPL